MDPLPPPEDRAWLVEGLAQLIAQRGAANFLRAPIVEPTPEFFPDAWQPDERGVRALCKRLLAYAELELDVALELYDSPEQQDADARGNVVTRHAGAAAWFAGIDGKTARFGVDRRQLAEPAAVVGTMCHEIAHAFRHAHGIVERDRDLEERLTDLTTIYLGFGILTTNNAYRYRTGRDHKGSSYSHTHTGYLSPQAMALLLALQTTARRVDERAHKRIAKVLEVNQAAFYRAACKHLRENRELVALLELPGVAEPASPHARGKVIDIRARRKRPPEDAGELTGAPLVLHNLGKRGRPVPARIDPRPIALAAGLGMAVAALVALLIAGALLGPAMAGGATLGAIVGAIAARRDRARVCNLCGEPVDDKPTCGVCGARLQA